uniref:Alcohol dehydrogenase [acceptor] n=1 Tax=Cacopsylla melanoneura TaxID=428564 RepID=A0A8D9AIG5_9HEMI
MWSQVNFCCVYLIYSCSYTVFVTILYITNFLFTYSSFLYSTSNVNFTHVTFDYIVVGSGSGGSILVHELLQDNTRNHSILLLEAGPMSYSLLNLPMLAPLLQRTPYDWAFETVPQKDACWGLQNQISKWPRGKILGGSSRLNYMVYLRGHKNDFDSSWPSSWTFSDFNQFSSVSYKPIDPFSLLSHHLVPDNQWVDLNQGNVTGYMNTPLTRSEGLRSCCDHYIDLENERLTVLTEAFVTKVLFEGNTAVGVEYEVHGSQYRASGNTVVLSAGAVMSPHILLHSGIGARDQLKQHKIPVLVDSPGVGQNLQDHIGVGVDNVAINITFVSPYEVLNWRNSWDFITKREGLWTFGGVELVSLLKTDPSLPVPDIQFMIAPMGISIDAGTGFRHSMGFKPEVWDSYFQTLDGSGGSVFSILVVLLHPRSKGDIRLTSSDPHDPPRIDPRYLTDRRDVETLIKGIGLVKDLLRSNPRLRALNATLRASSLIPGCESHPVDSHSYWECYVRTLSVTSYHPVGTCAMGTVVDSHLQVKGVQNLYIGDASVFPTMPSANTQALTILAGHKLGRHLKYLAYARSVSCPRRFIWSAQCCLLED